MAKTLTENIAGRLKELQEMRDQTMRSGKAMLLDERIDELKRVLDIIYRNKDQQ